MAKASLSHLEMWTIYRRPRDYPNDFVARAWRIEAGGKIEMMLTVIVKPTLAELRSRLLEEYPNLVCLPRKTMDDPVIVETWV